MPATTLMAAPPAQRASAELSVASVPGYFLSAATGMGDAGVRIDQWLLLLEPDSLIRVPGLVVGGRAVGGEAQGGYTEPLIGYRSYLDGKRRFAASLVSYASQVSGADSGASVKAQRVGGEGGFDFRVSPESKGLELHLWLTASLTGLAANGTYCIGGDATPSDCSEETETIQVHGKGVYPSVAGGLGFDFARRIGIVFHGGRFALMWAGGTMPSVEGGQQVGARAYHAFGFSLSAALGAVD